MHGITKIVKYILLDFWVCSIVGYFLTVVSTSLQGD